MQILCLAEQIQFTEDVERALKEQNLQRLAMELNAKLEHYTTVDTSPKDPADAGRPVDVWVHLLWIIFVFLRFTAENRFCFNAQLQKHSQN